MLLAFTCILAAVQEDPTRIKVVDGKIEGVFYGFSAVSDLWGNVRRDMRTIRKDGTMYFGAPEGSFEDFTRRALTADEKKESGTYTIDGTKFKFTYRDGSPEEGEITFAADGSITYIRASAMWFYPIRRGIAFDLAGYFSCTSSFNNNAYKMTTMVFSSYSFHKNGLFVLESGVSTTCRTDITIDDMRGELRTHFGGAANDRIGRFEVKGSGLTLTLDNGTKKTMFIGQIGEAKKGASVMLLLGRSLYEGLPGYLPADDLPRCKAEQFELRLPKGWSTSDQETGGYRVHTLSPGEGAGLAILAIGMDVDGSATAGGKETVAELRKLVAGWVGAKLEKGGDVEAMALDGADARRIPMQFDRDGTTIRVDAIYAVKTGRAMLLVAIGTVDGAKARAAEIKGILAGVRFAVDETVKAATADVDFHLAKAWKTKEVETEGATSLALLPPGVKEGDFFGAIVSQKSDLTSADDKKAVAWLRQQVEEAIPGLQPQGEPELFSADGVPAAGLKYAAKTDGGDVVVVLAYAIIKNGKVVMLIAGGKEAAVTKYSGAARRAFETVRVKK